jgi:PHD/YefM family antitoxin component YafN of YafNO toxin-antitoxin module
LEETLAILSDPQLAASVRRGGDELTRGESVSLDQVRAELEAQHGPR